jgi:hypothetical protein
MIDFTHVKVHRRVAGAVGGNQKMGVSKWGLNTKVHIAVDSSGMPARVIEGWMIALGLS